MLLCFFLSCYFYGASLNPILILPALAGPLGILCVTPAARLACLAQQHPFVLWGSICSVALIIAHQLLFSISPATSFIPGIVLASLPLWLVTVSVLRNPRMFWVLVSLLVAVFALITSIEFLIDRQRAHAPLRDPGNYLTLLYLVWLPWMLATLRRRLEAWQVVLVFVFSSLVMLAMLATHLRFAMIVGLLIVPVSAWLWFRFRCQWQTIAAMCGGVCAAFILYLLLDPTGAASSFDGGAVVSVQDSPRMLLWQSAWEAIRTVGGLNGTGLSTFSVLYPMFRSLGEQSTAGLLVHNDLLQLLLEGGVWLSVPVLLLGAGIGLSLAVQLSGSRLQRETGLLLALSVAVMHSTVNFVFYVLPLVILIAVLLAMAFVIYPNLRETEKTDATAAEEGGDEGGYNSGAVRRWRIGKAAGIMILLLNISWVMLDVMTLGVFAGYGQAPGAAAIRANPEQALDFARTAQWLNKRRGLPVFAEAQLLEQQLTKAATPLLLNQTEQAYRRAIEKDPWNVAAALNYAAFKASFNDVEAQRTILAGVLRMQPYNFYANASMLQLRSAAGDLQGAGEIAVNILQWCELLKRAPQAEQLFSTAADIARQAGAEEVAALAQGCIAASKRPGGNGRRQRWLMRLASGVPSG